MSAKKLLACLTVGLVLQAISSCGDANSGASVGLRLQPVPSTGRLTARISSERGSVADASVTVDGTLLGKSDGAGAFAAELKTGRHHVKITAPGFMDWEHDVPVFGDSWQNEISMVPLSMPTLVTAGQATTIQVGAAALLFPAGAYSSDVQVQTALVEGMSNANPGSYMFTDASGDARVTLYALHVRAPSEPAAVVTLEVTPPAGTPTDALQLFHLDAAGEATEPSAPTQVVNGKATFQISHFSDVVVTAKATTEVARIRDLSGVVQYQVPPDTSWKTAQRGDPLKEGMILRTLEGAATLSYPLGTNVRLEQGTTFKVTAQPTGVAWLGFSFKRIIRLWSDRFKKLDKNRHVSAPCAVRGSIASWESAPLAQDPNLEEIDFQIYEGEGVCALPSGEQRVIPEGQGASGLLPVGADGTAPGAKDAGPSGSCGSVSSCGSFCSSLHQRAIQMCNDKGGTIVSEFNSAACLSTCECMNRSCPALLTCVTNPACPGCDQPFCESVLQSCGWAPWLKCQVTI